MVARRVEAAVEKYKSSQEKTCVKDKSKEVID